MPKPVVHFVGVGPGGIEYLTLAGKDLITSADILFYDGNVLPQFLSLASRDVITSVYAGMKSPIF